MEESGAPGEAPVAAFWTGAGWPGSSVETGLEVTEPGLSQACISSESACQREDGGLDDHPFTSPGRLAWVFFPPASLGFSVCRQGGSGTLSAESY